MTYKPEPCPFCGGKPDQFGVYDAFRCTTCSEHSGWMAIKVWNFRYPIQSALNDAEETKKLLRELWEWSRSEEVKVWFYMAWNHGCRVSPEFVAKVDDMNKRIEEALSKIETGGE